MFSLILFKAEHYGRWLEMIRPPVIFLDCWYSLDVLPLVLAARERGTPTVDVQHGIQGASHPAYAAWPRLKTPQFIPHTFWLWGEQDRAIFMHDSNELKGIADAVVGGSLEINYYRTLLAEHPPHATDAPGNLTVLVTEQKGIDVSHILGPAIRKTTPTVQWIIRHHPGEATSPLRSKLDKPLPPGVSFVDPAAETVFESLARADIHVTGFSTVALEALALHRRTILVHPAATEIFSRFIRQQLMFEAFGAETLCELLAETPSVEKAAFEAVEQDIFAAPEHTRRTLSLLLGETVSA